MEGNFDLNIFDEFTYIENIYNALPFSDYNESDGVKNDFLLDLLKIDFTPSFDDNKLFTSNSEELINKLNKIEQNYNNIIQDNIVSSPTTSKF
jgi:hypothetical protein